MQTLTIDLENCYGIRKLEKKLDFSAARAIAIYAPATGSSGNVVGVA